MAAGLDVWYDENELDGGDSWDQKIRRQIRECDYFMPMVSATTESRPEGYFRREWRLAVERTLDMADDHTFLLPVVIDATSEAGARVPERFLAVQWVRAAGGHTTPALEALCRRIASGKAKQQPNRKGWEGSGKAGAPSSVRASFPEFPREEPGQRVRFGFEVIGWTLRCGWIGFKRLPRWVRYLAYMWLAAVLLAKGCSFSSDHHPHSAKLSTEQAQKLKAISEQYRGSMNSADVAKLGAQIANELSGIAETSTKGSAVLAVPFTATAADPTAAQIADATFAQLYGRISISHPGQVGLSKEPLSSLDPAAAQERGAQSHSTYVVTGGVDMQESTPVLRIKIVEVSDGTVVWSKYYPTSAADPQKIAAEVDSEVNSLDDLD